MASKNSKMEIFILKAILISAIIMFSSLPFINFDEMFTVKQDFPKVYASNSTKHTSKWELVFEENFEDLDSWRVVEQSAVYNNELQSYEKHNVQIKDNQLQIKGDKKEGEYTSGKIASKFAVKYGKIEVRAKTNSKFGSFPAIWMLPISGERLPEINIFEHTGKNNIAYFVNHYIEKENSQPNRSLKGLALDEYDYHTYTIKWTRDKIVWYVDGKEYFTSTKGVPQEEMYILINLAIGGNAVGTPELNSFPMYFNVDSVKIYKNSDQ